MKVLVIHYADGTSWTHTVSDDFVVQRDMLRHLARYFPARIFGIIKVEEQVYNEISQPE